MDMGMLGSLLGSTGQGFDYQNALTQQQRAYQAQQARQQAADQRTQTTFDEGQESYQHNLGRRPTLESQEDERNTATTKGLGLRNTIEQNLVDNLPKTNQQADDTFALNQARTKQAMDLAMKEYGIHASAAGNENALRALQVQQARLGLSDAQLAHQSAQAQQSLASGLVAYQDSGFKDPSDLISRYNQLHPTAAIDSLAQNKDGSFTAQTKSGNPMQFGSFNQLTDAAMMNAHPMALVESRHAQMQAENDPKNWETLEGENGAVARYNKVTNKVESVLDNKSQPFFGHLAGKNDPNSPLGLYNAVLHSGGGPADAIKAVHGAYPGWTPGGGQAPQLGAATPQPAAVPAGAQQPNGLGAAIRAPVAITTPGQAPTLPQNGRQVVRSGIDPTTHQRVVQYSDGAVELAPQ